MWQLLLCTRQPQSGVSAFNFSTGFLQTGCSLPFPVQSPSELPGASQASASCLGRIRCAQEALVKFISSSSQKVKTQTMYTCMQLSVDGWHSLCGVLALPHQ